MSSDSNIRSSTSSINSAATSAAAVVWSQSISVTVGLKLARERNWPVMALGRRGLQVRLGLIWFKPQWEGWARFHDGLGTYRPWGCAEDAPTAM